MAEEVKQPQQAEPARKELPQEELDVAYAGPAILANKFYVSITAGGARIAFCELQKAGTMPIFRSAIVVPFPDAIALADLIKDLISKNVHMVVENELPEGFGTPDGTKS